MNFTAREEYGLRAVMHLAMSKGITPIQSREIARAEGIPEQFLEQVLVSLRRGGIVRSIRGASGGYELARSPHDITAGDVLRALSGPIVPVECLNGDPGYCDKYEKCAVVGLWFKVQRAVSEILDGTTIQDLVEEQARQEQQGSFMMYI